jgi:hypothetical protein
MPDNLIHAPAPDPTPKLPAHKKRLHTKRLQVCHLPNHPYILDTPIPRLIHSSQKWQGLKLSLNGNTTMLLLATLPFQFEIPYIPFYITMSEDDQDCFFLAYEVCNSNSKGNQGRPYVRVSIYVPQLILTHY